ncbi:hypothetical protein F8M41_005111 [Gigaspora margarita]|uniref:Uncharacterized protein n=1 Tax=Gigaspora margarita TaxID=4874 RepID=A0A8H3XBM2_GIGMA|nr:hypothetical protein F8M41_005111 [Gigaspora margarita]
METRFRDLEKTIQPLLNKLNMDKKLEIKEMQVVLRDQEHIFEETIEKSDKKSKIQQIHENILLYLQDLNQDNNIDPIIPIKTTNRT